MATKITREEAINIVRNIYQTDKEKEALGILIPELAESEDERIRRWLCDYFSSIDKAWIHKDITCIDILRWLEKQKEQKHPNGCFTCDEYKKGYEEGRRNGFTAGYNKAMKEVEQKEQKPAEWDKEDKEMFEAVDESLYCYESGKAPEMVAQIEAERCWLHSLPERFNLQPKQEWSEEEIRKIRKEEYTNGFNNAAGFGK